MIKLHIEYFAVLREQAGLDGEQIETDVTTPAELFAELTKRHGFPELTTVKVAINDEFGDWQAQLRDGDLIVFIPPVAGG